jgi:hypothetical protein
MQLQQMMNGFLNVERPCPALSQPSPIEPESGLPAAIYNWPETWRHRFDTTSEVIKKLLPISPLHAEAAAEIAVRCEFAHQHKQGDLL